MSARPPMPCWDGDGNPLNGEAASIDIENGVARLEALLSASESRADAMAKVVEAARALAVAKSEHDWLGVAPAIGEDQGARRAIAQDHRRAVSNLYAAVAAYESTQHNRAQAQKEHNA